MEIPIGKRIVEVRYMSYIFNSDMKNEILNVYLKFDNGLWYKITICDGKSEFQIVNEPILSDCSCQEKMCYPISRMGKINLQQLGKLLNVNEYLWQGYQDESIGYIFLFDNNATMSILDEDEQIYININQDAERLLNYKIREKKFIDKCDNNFNK